MHDGAAKAGQTYGKRWLLPAAGALGVSCIATQLVLMREMVCVFAGNELVLGIVLGNWLLLMGLGSWFGRRAETLRNSRSVFIAGQILLALVSVALVCLTRELRLSVFPRGADVDIRATVLGSFLVLLPYCMPAGFLLTLACAVVAAASRSPKAAGQVYWADSVGSIVGGALVGLLLVRVLDSFTLLAAIGVLNLTFAILLARQQREVWLTAAAIAAGCTIAFVVFVLKPEASLTQLQYPAARILFRGNSPYGRIVVTSADHQINFIQNGLPVLYTHNTEEVEEAVHYAMVQRPAARRVLLVGGGLTGTAKELLKYPAEVTYVELDPLFLALGRRFLPQNLTDPRIHVVNTDGRRFVQTTHEKFDVIILDLADPVTAQLNRFHTAEFFAEAKRALNSNGVLALAVGRYENFVSPELAGVLATAHQTLSGAFKNVMMVPGGRVFFLASDGDLGMNIAERLERAQIPTRFVNRHYLSAMLTPDRISALHRALKSDAPVNRDFNPALYFKCLRHWASQFDVRFGFIGALLMLGLATYVFYLRGAAAALFASGFAASSLEVVLLLGFQALCGSLYYQLGIIVTVFMAGLAAGAAWANRAADLLPPRRIVGTNRFRGRHLLATISLVIAAFSALLPFALKLLSESPLARSSTFIIEVAIGSLTFILAGAVGAQFPMANRIAPGGSTLTASRLYTADFIGASVGALLSSAWLIPTLGVTMMCAIAAGLNVLGAMAVCLRRATPV